MSDGRGRSLPRDLLRFAMVGGVGFVADIVLFNVLRATILAPGGVPGAVLLAKGISIVAAILINWVGNRWWTFRDRRRSKLLPEALSFFAVSVTGSMIALGCLAVSHYVLGLTTAFADNISANVIGLLLGSLFRFAASRRWVFRPDRSAIAATVLIENRPAQSPS